MRAVFLRFLGRLLIDRDYKLIRVKSWRPGWGKYGLEWPTIVYDTKGGLRSVGAPCWDRVFLRLLVRRLIGRAP